MPDTILRVEDLRVTYPLELSIADMLARRRRYVRAVDGVSFEVSRGESYCIVGESGCGKTSTGKAIARILPDRYVSGKVLVRLAPQDTEYVRRVAPGAVEDGDMVNIYAMTPQQFRPLRKYIQMVFQDPYGSVNPRKKVRQIVAEPVYALKPRADPGEVYHLVSLALERVGLDPTRFMDRYPYDMSGGELQRVVIARAIVLNPVILVADEPVTMLDVSIRAEVIEALSALKKDGLAEVIITHDLATARYMCDRIAVMYLGRIVEEAPAENLVRRPRHPYTRALVAASPDPDPANRLRERAVPIKGLIERITGEIKGCRFRPRCLAYDQNPAVRPKCDAEEPPLFEVGRNHRVACWLYERR